MVQTAAYDPSYDNSPITRVSLTDAAGQPVPGTGTGTGSGQVQGTAADNAAAVGNPVLTGAKYNATPQVYGDGDVANNQADVAGNLKVTLGTLTGATVPAGAVYMAAQSTVTGNLTGLTTSASGANVIGSTVLATGLMAQLDDTATTAITENQFGNVRISSDRSVIMTPRATTPTTTSVAGSATTVTLLAANAARKGATIFNESAAVLYLKLGGTASITSYSTQLAVNAYYEVPFGYIGVIDGIWASAVGAARITEIA